MSRDETVSLSHKSNVESHHEYLDENTDGERTANTSLSVAEHISTRDQESRMKSVTNLRGIPHQSTREQSLDLATAKEVKADEQVGGSQVCTSPVLEPGPQSTGSGIESACAVVAVAAGARLSKEFIRGDTSSTKVREQMKSESKESIAGTQEKCDIREQATSS